MDRKFIIILALTSIICFGLGIATTVMAEQSQGTPESGADSRIKETYDDLVTLNYGSDNSGAWGDWGGMWNRLKSSAEWTPNGNLNAGEVIEGKTFYNDSRGESVGTLEVTNYEAQSVSERDDIALVDFGETVTWTKTNETPEVWKDEVTKLYWSGVQGTATSNNFNRATCDFFSNSLRGDYNGLTSACGNAINRCALLELDANADGIVDTKWYLPTIKELSQASIHGVYKGTNTDWVTTGTFWSSTERYDGGTYKWFSYFYYNYNVTATYSSTYGVRCVLRELSN